MSLKLRVTEDMKTAMRAKDAPRLGTLRLLLAAIKQKEVDERVELNDADVISVIEKMQKQRRDSISQFEAAGRQDLADAEKFETEVLAIYMPTGLTEAELATIVTAAVTASGATSAADMGKVMAIIKPQVAGRADMGLVSKLVKSQLST